MKFSLLSLLLLLTICFFTTDAALSVKLYLLEQWALTKSVLLAAAVTACGTWFFTYFQVLTWDENQKPNLEEVVRYPVEGKKWEDYDFSTNIEGTNIFYFVWFAHMCSIIAPYEIRILTMTHDKLLGAQELEHAIVSKNWNKAIEKDFGIPIYTFFQLKVWKPILFEYITKFSKKVNLAIGCALEAMFCWLVYALTINNGFIYKTMGLRTWVWSYHLLEEVEHTHISVPEMREGLSTIQKILCWLLFDILVIIPILLIVTPISAIIYFPERVFTFRGIKECIAYILFIMVVIPFVAMGQFCEMILCLNWKKETLEQLWTSWYEQNYKVDCLNENGEEMFQKVLTKSGLPVRTSTVRSAGHARTLHQEHKIPYKIVRSSTERAIKE